MVRLWDSGLPVAVDVQSILIVIKRMDKRDMEFYSILTRTRIAVADLCDDFLGPN